MEISCCRRRMVATKRGSEPPRRSEAASSVKRPRGSSAEACELQAEDLSHEKELPSLSSTALGSSASSTSEDKERFDGLRRSELVRLIGQALGDLGLEATRATLEAESGIKAEATAVTELRCSVISGEWDQALGAAQRLTREPSMQGAQEVANLRHSLLEQKCLQLHRSGDVEAAKQVFAEIADVAGLEGLSQQLDMTPQELADSSPSRDDVADRLVDLLPVDLALPPRRLSALLWQAVRYQQLHCLYTDLDPSLMYQQLHCLSTDMDPTLLSCGPSLLKDYSYTAPLFPTHCVARLNHHRDEVWFAVVTDDGRYLASSSKDESIIVWECTAGPSFSVTEVLIGHSAPCAALAWSPDGQRLLSASSDGTVRLWTLPGPEEPEIFARHADSVSAVAWLPDGEHFLSGGFDRCLLLWKTDGNLQHRWELQCRVQDLATTPDGSRVLVVDSDKGIKVFDVASRKELAPLPESDAVTSISASRLRDEFLVNVAQHVSALQQGPSVRLWDLQTRRVAQRYVGHFQGRFVVRSAFIGEREELVASGSEDAQVYIWHRHYGSLLQVLPGHTATVNSVCWIQGPAASGVSASSWLVSASDDCTMRVWGAEAAAADLDDAESVEAEAAALGTEDLRQRNLEVAEQEQAGTDDAERRNRAGFEASFHLEALEASDVSGDESERQS